MGMLYGRTTDNKAVKASPASSFPIMCNGNPTYTAAGGPAAVQDMQYPMTHLLNHDRYTPWSSPVGTSPSSVTIHLDLAGGGISAGGGSATADKAVSSFGLMGLRGNNGTAAPQFASLGFRTKAQGYGGPGTYTAAGAGTFNTGQSRDCLFQFAQIDARYWEIVLTSVTLSGVSLGSIWLGVLLDLGIYWSAAGGGEWQQEQNVLWSRTAGGHTTGVKRGDPWHRATMNFGSVTTAQRAALIGDFGPSFMPKPMLMVDENNVVRQFVVQGGPTSTSRFKGLYDVSVEIETLG